MLDRKPRRVKAGDGHAIGAPLRLAPEDEGRVAIDLGEQVRDVRRGRDQLILVELRVAVGPVQGPLVAGLGVAQTRHRGTDPVGTQLRFPRRTTLEDREGAVADVEFDADLVLVLLGHLVVLGLHPPFHPGTISFGDNGGLVTTKALIMLRLYVGRAE